jgi:serine/threonine-protein kinase
MIDRDPDVRARRGVARAALVLGAVYAGFVAYVVTSSAGLPERVATHFNGAGRADGWMSRPAHVGWTVVGGLAVPAIVVGVMFVMRFVSDEFVNVPNKAYWLEEGRRGETFDYLLRHGIWLGCWLVGLFIALQYLVVEANARRPAGLGAAAGWLVGGFVAGVAGWVGVLIWHFARVPAKEAVAEPAHR